MKKIIKLTAFLFAGLIAGGCSNEEPTIAISDNDEQTVNFSINIENMLANESDTRSLASGYHFSDGRSISVVKCYVYSQAAGANATPVKTIDISTTNLKGEVSIPLPKNEVFDVVFLATSIPQDNSAAKLYYSTTERCLNINYNNCTNNDEEMDCFYAAKTGISSSSAETVSVELKRPFAQLNIGAKDFAAYDAANAVKSTSVTISSIYNKLNLMDGSVVGSPVNVTFAANAMPSGQTFPAAGYQYISMDYLLVNQRKLTTVALTINHQNSFVAPLVLYYNNISVERNYQTNLCIKSLIN